MNIIDLHQYMWDRVDHRHRVQILNGVVAEVFGVHRDIISEAVLAMRATGRIKYVACRPGKRYVYQVTDPDAFCPTNHETTLTRPSRPAWG